MKLRQSAMKEAEEKPRNHGKKWEQDGYDALEEAFKKGAKVETLAVICGRKKDSILCNLSKLRLVSVEQDGYYRKTYRTTCKVEWWKWPEEVLAEWERTPEEECKLLNYRAESGQTGGMVFTAGSRTGKASLNEDLHEAGAELIDGTISAAMASRLIGGSITCSKMETPRLDVDDLQEIDLSSWEIAVPKPVMTSYTFDEITALQGQTKGTQMKFETKHYLNSREISTYSDDELIDLLHRLEGERKSLTAIETQNNLTEKKLREIEEGIKRLVEHMNERAPKVTLRKAKAAE